MATLSIIITQGIKSSKTFTLSFHTSDSDTDPIPSGISVTCGGVTKRADINYSWDSSTNSLLYSASVTFTNVKVGDSYTINPVDEMNSRHKYYFYWNKEGTIKDFNEERIGRGQSALIYATITLQKASNVTDTHFILAYTADAMLWKANLPVYQFPQYINYVIIDNKEGVTISESMKEISIIDNSRADTLSTKKVKFGYPSPIYILQGTTDTLSYKDNTIDISNTPANKEDRTITITK